MPRQQVVVEMSGGVDSSLTAALLQEAGYDVTGIYMQLFPGNHYRIPDLENIEGLERTCQTLRIPLHKLSLETEFRQAVIEYFCQEYCQGRTPNPCVMCNRHLKFGLLLDKALQMGADYLATGHYARIKCKAGGYQLLKAYYRSKDQSYFLYTLGQKALQYLRLPLGQHRKIEVRRLAARLGLPAASQHDSQDICFIPSNDYRSFIAKHIPVEPGDIVDTDGRVLGKHDGLAYYTVGQRHGLGLNTHPPLHVMKLDTSHNQLVVAPRERLFSRKLRASRLNWISGQPPTRPAESIAVTAKIRSGAAEAAATLVLNDTGAEATFVEPQWAVTPGQSVVFYQGNAVLGGGIIEGSEDEADTISG